MPRNGSGVYSLPAGLPVNGETSDATDDIRTPFSDLEADANTVRPVVAGGTGASDAATARTNLGISLAGLGAQAADADLTALAALASTGIMVRTGTATYATRSLTPGACIEFGNPAGIAGDIVVGVAPGTISTTQIAAATLVTAAETIASNNNDTTIPTSAAVKAYADALGTDIFFRLNAAHVGADTSSAQNLFPLSVSLAASTVYEYEIFWSVSKTAGVTSHTLSTGFGGTASLNNIQRNFAFNGSTTLTYTSGYTSAGYLLTATSTLFANAVASATVNYWNVERGTVSINGAGTFIPQYTLSAAPGGAYSTNLGSYFRLRRLGASGANLSSGSWA